MLRRKPRPTTKGSVLIIVQNLPVPLDRRVWLESQTLRDAGFAVSVISPKGPGDRSFEELDGIRLYKYRPAPVANSAAAYAFEFAYCWLATLVLALQAYWHEPFDVIQACNPPDTFWALAKLFRFRGVRFVFDQHDLCPEVYLARFEEPSRLLLSGLKLLERASYRSANHVVVTNSLYGETARARGHLEPSRVTVVRNGPLPDRFVKGAAEPALRNGREFLCCYLGIMGPQDGVDLLVHVARELKDRGRDDVQLGVLGFGDKLDFLRELASALDVEDRITFTGRADDAMVKAWFSTADVGLVPDPKTPFNDVSSMNKTVEYMAFGLPLVAFDLRETMATAERAGIYVEGSDVGSFTDAVVQLLDDPARRREMGELGRDKFVRELSWPHQAGAYRAVYEGLLTRRG